MVKKYFSRTTLKLSLGITLLVVIVFGIGGYGISTQHRKAQMSLWKEAAISQNVLIRLGLEHQMIDKERDLILSMLDSFAKTSSVKRVFIVDHKGKVIFASHRDLIGKVYSKESETCWPCHQSKPKDRPRFTILKPNNSEELRCVEPILNKKICHECHDPKNKINGILILDIPIDALETQLKSDVFWIITGSTVLAFFLLLGIGLVVRWLISKRLSKLSTAARLIARGELGLKVDIQGDDLIASLGREFNTMADSISAHIENIRTHKTQLENVMNSVSDGLVVLDREHMIIAANESFIRLFNVSRDKILMHKCHEVLPRTFGCHPDKGKCPSKKCFETEKLETGIFYLSEDSDEERIEEVHASPIFDGDGNVVQVVEVWRDITARRKDEARLAEFHRLASVGMLASGFSHEVNTPLTSMLVCADRTIERTKEPEPLTEDDRTEIAGLAKTIRDEILRCKSITELFLKFSRKKDLAVDLLKVSEIIETVLPVVSATARAAGVTITVESGPSDAAVFVNEGAMQQLILNLLINAIQASKKGEKIKITYEKSEDIRIRVIDEGVGITREDRRRIFEPFFSKKSEGTGLGLFISQMIVKMWGGEIAVESEPGAGSCFEIILPLPEDPTNDFQN